VRVAGLISDEANSGEGASAGDGERASGGAPADQLALPV